MQELPSIEHLITEFISLGQEDVDRSFRRGEIAYHIVNMGQSIKQLAQYSNCSGELIRVLIRTFEAFPTEQDRQYHELSFYHYRLAARTDDPHYWMKEATDNEWSTRELTKAIKVEPVQDDYREAEALLFKVKRTLNDEAVGEWFKTKLESLLQHEKNKCVLEEKDMATL